MDPTPRIVRHAAAAHEFSESWSSPALQRYLGAELGSPGAPKDGGPARSQQALAAIRHKEALGASGGSSCKDDYIPAYQPHPASPPPLSDTHAADYRTQLQQYAQQLTTKAAEAAALRDQASQLKQQLAAAESRAANAGKQVTRNASAASQLEAAAAALEGQLQEREQELQAALQARRAAEQAVAAARAQVAAGQKAVAAKAAEWEQDRRFFKEQLEAKDQELHSLEDALRKQAAELERQSREWVQREADVSSAHSRSNGAAAAVHAELAAAQGKAEAAAKRVRVLEGENGELRRQKAQVAADLRMVEELLGDSDAERRDLHDKYVKLGERLEGLVKEGKILKGAASAESGAARSAVQEAMRDAEVALKERAGLMAQVSQLQARLDEEQSRHSVFKDSVQRKLAGAEQEVTALRGELEGKVRQLQGLQGDMKALQAEAEGKLGTCEKQLLTCKDHMAALKHEVEAERHRASKAASDAEALASERLRLELQQQALKYEQRIQELEVHGGGISGGRLLCPGSTVGRVLGVLDYIPRAEHVRLVEARLAAKEGDLQLEMSSRVAQAEREAQWKLETKEQEIGSLTARIRQLEDELHAERQRSSSAAHKLEDESNRSAAQCVELQRELASREKELARLKETLKDARSANADMDDDAMNSSRQVARLRHALDDSQQALKEAQMALTEERKRCEDTQREATVHAAQAGDAGRRAERAAGEVRELEAALEQKQELIAALQAESDTWSAKLMAHRDYHESEVEALRTQLKEECEVQVDALEQQCQAGAAELRETRRQYEGALGQLGQQHAAQVGQLEAQLAAVERCNGELKELTTALGSVRQEDVETLQATVQELQARLKETVREREWLLKAHAGQLAALSAQVAAKMAAFRGQQVQLRQHLEGDVVGAFAECLSSFEAGMASLQQRLERQAATADSQQAELAGQVACLRGGMQRMLAALRAGGLHLPEATQHVLLEACGASGSAMAAAQAAAAQQVARAVQEHVQQAEVAAIDSALAAFEAELLAGNKVGGVVAAPQPASPIRQLSPRKRQQQQQREEAAVAAAAVVQRAPSLEANERRLEALLGRSQELLAQVAAGDAQVAALQQQVAALEATLSEHQDKFSQAKAESIQAAEAARSAAVAPLHTELVRLTQRVQGLQQLHSNELAGIQAAVQQQAAATKAEAQALVDRLAASGSSLQQQLRCETERAEGLSVDLARMQDELAKHTQRAATKIEVQERELGLLKGRIREMEARDAQLRQHGREASGGMRQL